MNKSTWRLVIVLMAVVLAVGCKGRHEATATGTGQTETMAPIRGDTAPTGTDALTQTVDVEDSRSEAEGGNLTEPQTAATKAKPAAAAGAAGAKKPAKKPSGTKH